MKRARPRRGAGTEVRDMDVSVSQPPDGGARTEESMANADSQRRGARAWGGSMLSRVWLVSAWVGGDKEKETGTKTERDRGTEKEATSKRARERGQREGRGKGMTAIGVGGPEHFLEEDAWRTPVEFRAGRGPNKRWVRARTGGWGVLPVAVLQCQQAGYFWKVLTSEPTVPPQRAQVSSPFLPTLTSRMLAHPTFHT